MSILILSALLLPAPAWAQVVPGLPISVEVRPLLAMPTGDFADGRPGFGAEIGFGVSATTRLHLTSDVAAYGGYQYGRFGCGECGAVGLEDALPEAGFEVGIRAELPYRPRGLDPWLSAGALIARELEISGQAGGALVSDPAVGWSGGAGVLIPFGGSLQLTPGVHYRSYSAQFAFTALGFDSFDDTGAFARKVEVASLSVEVGLSYEF